MTWQPAPGEVLRMRWPIEIATGVAPLVEGRRSFRGAGRRDIERELQAEEDRPGRPEVAVPNAGEQRGQRAVNGLLRRVPTMVGAIADPGGPSRVGSDPREPRDPSASREPEVTETARRFKADSSRPPVFTRLPSGLVHAELRRATGKAGSPVSLCVDTGGGPAAPRPGDM
ncbi:hypothetical protein ABZ901_23450 [Actinacidiphila alni]|uniref:hypothetical protein n=1 Tax=Actinacidiphila alni TaxID=380248 RepID=UPI0033EB248F